MIQDSTEFQKGWWTAIYSQWPGATLKGLGVWWAVLLQSGSWQEASEAQGREFLQWWNSGRDRSDRIQRELETGQRLGMKFLFPGHEDYPKNFEYLSEPPLFLSYFGEPCWRTQPGLAVVGSRQPQSASVMWLERELLELLRSFPLAIVSGGARGVDQAAHRVALRRRTPTVVWLPSGLLRPYPESWLQWRENVVSAGGAVISEFLPETSMHKSFFQRRNRLIAGLSLGTLVVEARRRSGTWLTAQQTVEQGKPLFVMPGHPMDVGSLGSLDLLFDGATPVRDAQDLKDFLWAELQAYQWRNGMHSGHLEDSPLALVGTSNTQQSETSDAEQK